jgi:hypothetical protein
VKDKNLFRSKARINWGIVHDHTELGATHGGTIPIHRASQNQNGS